MNRSRALPPILTPPCGAGCASTPRTIRAVVSGRPTTMPAVKDGSSITRRFNVCGVRKGCAFLSGAAVNVTAPRPPPTCRPLMPPTGSGRWTSSSTPPPTGARSRSPPSSTNTPAGAWVVWSSALSPARTSAPNSTASPPSVAATQPSCDATTDPNWPATPWPPGPTANSACTSSRPASPGATATSSRSIHPRRMPQHQQLLVTGPRPCRHQRLETRLQPPPPAALIAGIPTTSPLRCHLHPLNDSLPSWTTSRGPVTTPILPLAPNHV